MTVYRKLNWDSDVSISTISDSELASCTSVHPYHRGNGHELGIQASLHQSLTLQLASCVTSDIFLTLWPSPCSSVKFHSTSFYSFCSFWLVVENPIFLISWFSECISVSPPVDTQTSKWNFTALPILRKKSWWQGNSYLIKEPNDQLYELFDFWKKSEARVPLFFLDGLQMWQLLIVKVSYRKVIWRKKPCQFQLSDCCQDLINLSMFPVDATRSCWHSKWKFYWLLFFQREREFEKEIKISLGSGYVADLLNLNRAMKVIDKQTSLNAQKSKKRLPAMNNTKAIKSYNLKSVKILIDYIEYIVL